jgi:hypothetical protein
MPAPNAVQSIRRKSMGGANHTITKRPLKPFKHFLAERFRDPRQPGALGKALNEEAIEVNITAASTIVIPSNVTDKEREDLIYSFFEDISNMSGPIFAIAVACD